MLHLRTRNERFAYSIDPPTIFANERISVGIPDNDLMMTIELKLKCIYINLYGVLHTAHGQKQ